MKILFIAGARPNFMKIAPLIHQAARLPGLDWKLVHTGQHYDYKMSEVFFRDFDIPEPDFFLDGGPGTHAAQTARVMVSFEKVCMSEKPDMALVVGDVNSTLACSITAKKLNIKVAHVEAGLRSGDMAMPEEINRIVTDSISDYLFVSEKSGLENLKNEGKGGENVILAGNVMVDALFFGLNKLSCWGAKTSWHSDDGQGYAVLTLHRPSNVDDRGRLEGILEAIGEIASDMDIYMPLHPRTEKNIRDFNLDHMLDGPHINILPPLSYLDFLSLWKDSSLVLTDSGGIQEETTAVGVPCFTIRENTERPATVVEGTNTLVGTTKEGILEAYGNFKRGMRKAGRLPELWDGKASQRILRALLDKAGSV